MQSKNKQKGLTGVSIVVLLVFFAFFAVALLKIMPIYFDSFKVGDVVSGLKDERGLGATPNSQIVKMILQYSESCVNSIIVISLNAACDSYLNFRIGLVIRYKKTVIGRCTRYKPNTLLRSYLL